MNQHLVEFKQCEIISPPVVEPVIEPDFILAISGNATNLLKIDENGNVVETIILPGIAPSEIKKIIKRFDKIIVMGLEVPVTSFIAIYSLGFDLLQVKRFSYHTGLMDVDMDINGNIYCAHSGSEYISGFKTIEKYDSNFNLIYSTTHGNSVLGITVNSDGSEFWINGISSASSVTARKYNANTGTIIYSVALGSPGIKFHVDYTDNVSDKNTQYIRLTTNFRKFNHEGLPLFTLSAGANGVIIDNDYVYTTGPVSLGVSTRKLNKNGVLIWAVSHGNTSNGIIVGRKGDVYISGLVSPDSFTFRKYNKDGVLQLSKNINISSTSPLILI